MSGLTPVRLRDVPLELRLRAADRLTRTNPILDDPARPEDRLFARLLTDAGGGADQYRKVAAHPSPKVYWVPRDAYERVMHPKNRRTC